MQKIFYIRNEDVSEVNKELEKGASVVMMCPVPVPLSPYGYAGGQTKFTYRGKEVGNTVLYVVLEISSETK